MTKVFKQLSINGKSCRNDWIEINKKKNHVLELFPTSKCEIFLRDETN
jgi:hypothetical protein